MNNFFFELTIILLLAGLMVFFITLLKQPSIIGYILTGLIIGPLGYRQLHESGVLDALGQIGVTLLLFMVGLELDFRKIKQLGKVALFTGLGQIIFTFSAGYFICLALGFGIIASLYISIALTFSSTIIVVKLLAEKKDTQSLYGRICIGFLLVQDFVALLILLFLGSTSGGSGDIFAHLPVWQYGIALLTKTLGITLLLIWLSKKIFPKFINRFGKSDDLLLIFSVAWALGLSVFVSSPIMGFSLETGGFLAGLALANSYVHYEISGRIKSLRDFFIIIFFIVFGTKLVFVGIASMLLPALLLSLFVLIGNPLIVMLIMGFMGYKPRTSFFASVTVAQISEFSFVVAALGNRLGHLSDQVLGLVTLVGIVTIAGSSYMILYSHKLYNFLEPFLKWFDFKKGAAESKREDQPLANHIILAGAHRMGSHIAHYLQKQSIPFLVVDFDPFVIEDYLKRGFGAVCGDITDSYIQEQIGFDKAKMIISTIPDFQDNLRLLEAVRRVFGKKKKRPKLIFASQGDLETSHLYSKGVDYVLSPHFIGGMHLAKILEGRELSGGLKKLREHHLEIMLASGR